MAEEHAGSLGGLTEHRAGRPGLGHDPRGRAMLLTQLPGDPCGCGSRCDRPCAFPPASRARSGGSRPRRSLVVAAQQASTAVVVRLANARGSEGALGDLDRGVDRLPAALGGPCSATGDQRLPSAGRPRTRLVRRTGFAGLTAGVARTMLLVSAVAGGALAGVAPAVARVVALGVPGPPASTR